MGVTTHYARQFQVIACTITFPTMAAGWWSKAFALCDLVCQNRPCMYTYTPDQIYSSVLHIIVGRD